MTHSMIGVYGPWAANLIAHDPQPLSWRDSRWTDLDLWRSTARERVSSLLASPDAGTAPEATVTRTSVYDGLHVEELSWQLPYGPPTEAIFLKPANATGPLPAVLALHDHSGNKVLGKRKVAYAADTWPSMFQEHYDHLYGGRPWANHLASRGYAVLAFDAFAFASRRVRVADVPQAIRPSIDGHELDDDEVDDPEVMKAYNRWASEHESIMAKSLFCAGTTWPGVFLAEDQRALDVLCARPDVDADRVGCAGLSGGGLRTVYLAGMDDRIRCAVCAGMMTTWRDFLLNKSHTHTWMIYIPHLAPWLDYPEVLGLRVPLPTLVLNNIHDPLFTVPEMERADQILAQVFAKAGASDRYRCHFHPGHHKFDLPMQAQAFAWLDQWL